jgi:hypothetical protein
VSAAEIRRPLLKEYKFEVFNNRWNSTLTYRVRKIESGWHIAHQEINGNCEPDGNPLFYSNFNQDNISYPNNFGDFLEWLWEQMNQGEVAEDEAQKMLQELADWVSSCERSQPKWKGWNV